MTERDTPRDVDHGGHARQGDHDGQPSDAAGRRGGLEPLFQVRTSDLEPYVGLRYLSKLFRLIALILVLLLAAEVVTGLMRQGVDAIPTLVAEVSRLIVLAGLLWGIGDLAILLVDVGHDVRAVRILLGRQTAHLVHPPPAAPADAGERRA
ncbi:MAG TPA: hypothetical protein VFS05_09925 [Gemmatimonadaceae bacterium]|nr:hypothetical protein [Gemmatimonadaceae bacterium]